MGAQVLPTPLHPLRSPLGTENGMQATFSGLLCGVVWHIGLGMVCLDVYFN